MQRAGYSDLARHKQAHDRLRAELDQLLRRYEQEQGAEAIAEEISMFLKKLVNRPYVPRRQAVHVRAAPGGHRLTSAQGQPCRGLTRPPRAVTQTQSVPFLRFFYI